MFWFLFLLMVDFSATHFIILLSSNIYSLIAAVIRTTMFLLDRFVDLNLLLLSPSWASPSRPLFIHTKCTTILVISTHAHTNVPDTIVHNCIRNVKNCMSHSHRTHMMIISINLQFHFHFLLTLPLSFSRGICSAKIWLPTVENQKRRWTYLKINAEKNLFTLIKLQASRKNSKTE